jgi:hypothetical protein
LQSISEMNAKIGIQEFQQSNLFLINTIDRRVATAKSGRIVKVGNSGIVGVGEGVDVDMYEIGVA